MVEVIKLFKLIQETSSLNDKKAIIIAFILMQNNYNSNFHLLMIN